MDECIRRGELLHLIEEHKKEVMSNTFTGEVYGMAHDHIQDLVNIIPAAKVREDITAEWVHSRTVQYSNDRFEMVKCSNCGTESYRISVHVTTGHFCYMCGARVNPMPIEDEKTAAHG